MELDDAEIIIQTEMAAFIINAAPPDSSAAKMSGVDQVMWAIAYLGLLKWEKKGMVGSNTLSLPTRSGDDPSWYWVTMGYILNKMLIHHSTDILGQTTFHTHTITPADNLQPTESTFLLSIDNFLWITVDVHMFLCMDVLIYVTVSTHYCYISFVLWCSALIGEPIGGVTNIVEADWKFSLLNFFLKVWKYEVINCKNDMSSVK